MKIKTVYIYGTIAIIVAFVLIVSAIQSSSNNGVLTHSETKMPADDFHKSISDNPNQQPGSSNVTSETLSKLNELKKQFESMPDDTTRIREYADFLSMSHKQNDAIPLYEKILSNDPNRIDILFSLTFIYYNQNNMDKAEEFTKRILSADPANVQALYNSGAIQASRGNKVKARKIWEDLISSFPASETTELAKNSLKQIQ